MVNSELHAIPETQIGSQIYSSLRLFLVKLPYIPHSLNITHVSNNMSRLRAWQGAPVALFACHAYCAEGLHFSAFIFSVGI